MRSRTLEASGAQVPLRVLAGVSVPDTSLVRGAIEYARQHSEPYLFNHVMRSWLFAVSLAQLDGTPHDAEVLAVAAVLHDLGLSRDFDGPLRFEVEGANAAREFARVQGVDGRRAQLIWDGVALNSTPSIALHKEAEVGLCTAGTLLDWAGQGSERLTEGQMAAILEAFPRLDMKQQFTVRRLRHRREATGHHLRQLRTRLRGALCRRLQGAVDGRLLAERPV